MSLNQRAARLCAPPASSKAGASHPPKVKEPQPDRKIMYKWKDMIMKVILVVQIEAAKDKLKKWIGNSAYKALYQEAKQVREISQIPAFTQICKGEIVGRPMAPGEGTVQLPPTQCTHPDTMMTRHGNLHNKWWICKMCQSRWTRVPLGEAFVGEPTDEEVVLFGKYTGSTFLEVYGKDKKYLNFVIQTAESEPEAQAPLRRLAQYAVSKEFQNLQPTPTPVGQTSVTANLPGPNPSFPDGHVPTHRMDEIDTESEDWQMEHPPADLPSSFRKAM